MNSVSVVKNYYLERIKKLEAENQRLREMLKDAFEALAVLLVYKD
jgi:thioredoxin-related protein